MIVATTEIQDAKCKAPSTVREFLIKVAMKEKYLVFLEIKSLNKRNKRS